MATENAKITKAGFSAFMLKHMQDQKATDDAIKAAAKVVSDKVGGIEEGAQVNVIESVAVKGENIVTKNGKGLSIDLDAYAKKADVSTAVLYKGTVASYAELPTEGQKIGDMYNVTAADAEHAVKAGDNLVWNGTGWDNVAGVVDLSGKVDKADGERLMTDVEGSKLAGIQENATAVSVANTLEEGDVVANLTINGVTTPVKIPAVETMTVSEMEALYADIKAQAETPAQA